MFNMSFSKDPSPKLALIILTVILTDFSTAFSYILKHGTGSYYIYFSYNGTYTDRMYCKSSISIYLFGELFYVQDREVRFVNLS